MGLPAKKAFPHAETLKKDDIQLIRLRHQVWSKSVDMQMHFNNMSHKSRQLGLSFAVAALGFCAFMLTRDISFEVMGRHFHTLHATAIVLWIVALTLVPIGILDIFVYQRLLRGAVKFAWELENKKIVKEILGTDFGMSTYISMSDGALKKDMTAEGEPTGTLSPGLMESKPFATQSGLRAPHLIGIFYATMIGLMFLLGLALWRFDIQSGSTLTPKKTMTQLADETFFRRV